MRFAQFVILGSLALTYSISSAHADNAVQNFGTVPCQQRFDCGSIEQSQLTDMANTCAIRGFGLSVEQQTDMFSGSSPDANSCMDGQFLAADGNNTHPTRAHCCVIHIGDDCTMNCQLLMY